MSRADYISPYHAGCEDCVRCESCGENAYCLNDYGTRPCPHDRALCGEVDCLAAECGQCRQAMEDEAVASGDYSPAADPLFDHRARPSNTAADYAASSGLCVAHKSYKCHHPPEGSA